jgi:hypothetical protein
MIVTVSDGLVAPNAMDFAGSEGATDQMTAGPHALAAAMINARREIG